MRYRHPGRPGVQTTGAGSDGGESPTFEAGRPARDRGQSLVEMALLLPVLILILLGVIDLGRVFYSYEALANAAREGARYCALNPGNDAGTRARVAAELAGTVVADTTVTSCPATPQGSPVTVAVEATFTPITPMIGAITGGPLTLRNSATMVVWR